ncbi:acetate/propionate family kinase [Jonesia quinghaiensis]|uniref:acetate/propionate family kinase n=1 Tax=Jonesia quinghaiensis TaxID=262806 RepID=UPI0004026D5F|nr:acetate kinase [Jonesia quinghaiensis]
MSSATVLVINAGSSTIKYQLLDPATAEAIAGGIVERIGEDMGLVEHRYNGVEHSENIHIGDHGDGLREVLRLFEAHGPHLADANIVAVGHRVVQGGSVFPHPTLIDDHVLEQIRDLIPLAPLHNPGHVKGIEVARELFADVPHVAIFDTSFFQTLPEAAYTYALPRELAAQHSIRRYGFHGTSHQYVSEQAAMLLGRDYKDIKQIVAHLGSGASISAVKNGEAVETSMGLTPLEGLVMGTRTGDMDPAIVLHLQREAGMSADEVNTVLNKQSGLKGLCGENDFRELLRMIDEGNHEATVAFDVYVHRLVKYVGSYMAVLGGLPDVITFTAGVGENNALIRERVAQALAGFGVRIDPEVNNVRSKEARVVSAPDSTVTIAVIPTNEELAIARQTMDLIGQ